MNLIIKNKKDSNCLIQINLIGTYNVKKSGCYFYRVEIKAGNAQHFKKCILALTLQY